MGRDGWKSQAQPGREEAAVPGIGDGAWLAGVSLCRPGEGRDRFANIRVIMSAVGTLGVNY